MLIDESSTIANAHHLNVSGRATSTYQFTESLYVRSLPLVAYRIHHTNSATVFCSHFYYLQFLCQR